MIDDTECQLCPGGNEDAGCCSIDLGSFDFSCDVCETIGGTQECGKFAHNSSFLPAHFYAIIVRSFYLVFGVLTRCD